MAAEKLRVEKEKAELEAKLAKPKPLEAVTPIDRVDAKVTKIAEIAKAMKGELVRDGYLRAESRVKLSVTNGVIMVNSRPLRSEDYDKYRRLIRMMGINLYDGDTVIEF